MFDAYTVKKVLPRLVAAVILIQLSWFLFTGLIRITNLAAWSIEGLIYIPFGGREALSIENILLNGPAEISSLNTIFTGVVLGAGAAAASGGVFALAIIVVMALLVGFFVLTVRRVLLIALLVLSPIALVAWILPGTQRLWQLWWDNFSKLLLMYPLILGMIAMGRAFASIVPETLTDESNFLVVTIVMLAIFAPFALIPATYKAAGAGFAAISGAVKGRGDAISGAAGKMGRARQGKRWQKRGKDFAGGTLGGERFRNTRVGRGVNNLGERVGVGPGKRFGFGAGGVAALDLKRRQAAAEEMRSNAALQQAQFDDNGIAVLALSGGTLEGADRVSRILATNNGWSEEERRRAVGTARAVGINANTAAAGLDMMAQNKSRALTYRVDDEGNVHDLTGDAGMQLVAESAAQISHGNAQMTANMLGSFGFHSGNAGRLDLRAAPGGSMTAGWGRASTAQHAQSQTPSLRSYANSFQETILHSQDEGERRAAAVSLLEMQNMLPNATADNQAVINETLDAIGVDQSNPDTIATQLAQISGSPGLTGSELSRRARVYGDDVPVAAQQAAVEAGQQPPAPPPQQEQQQ